MIYLVGMVQQSQKSVYTTKFNKHQWAAFNCGHHWIYDTRILVLIKGEK